jgi:PAS domain S-box-containing protein
MSSELEDEFYKVLLRSYIDSTNDAIFVLCDEMKFLLCNNSGENCMGLTEEKLIEHNKRTPITELFSDTETIDLFNENFPHVLEGNDAKFESYVRPVNASPKWMEFTLNKVMLPDINMVIIVARDISERKIFEKSIKSYNELLEKQVEERTRELRLSNEQKDKLFSIISHDLRAPFNPIMGYAQMMIDESIDLTLEQAKDFCGKIALSSNRYKEFLDTLLEWSVLQLEGIKINKKNHDLLTISKSVIHLLLDSSSEKNITIHNNIKTMDFFADKNVMTTVLRNLISNAIKFTPNDGQITLNAQCSENVCCVEVVDTGVGMSKDYIEKVMLPNSNTHSVGTNNEAGTGLGLSICAGLLEKHGGIMEVTSTPGQGSNFKISIPQ